MAIVLNGINLSLVTGIFKSTIIFNHENSGLDKFISVKKRQIDTILLL